MNKIIVLIDGPDAEQVLSELISNAEYDKSNVVIWVADEDGGDVVLPRTTMAYMPKDEVSD